MNPAISICVPTYNGESYLSETLESLLAQSFSDFEIIIIDDESADNTFKIIQEYQTHDKRISRIRNKKNIGLAENWNRCIQEAKGLWIKFVFQDDLLHPECLEALYAETDNEIPLIFCRREFFFEQGITNDIIKGYQNIPSIDQLYPDKQFLSPSDIADCILKETSNIFGEPSSTLIHRNVFADFGYFNTSLLQLCDYEYWMRVGLNTGMRYVPRSLVKFRVHPSSASSKNIASNEYRSSLLDGLILLHEFVYNPHYQSLRDYIKQEQIDRNLRREFAEKATWLKNFGRVIDDMSQDVYNAKSSWKDVAEIYPNIEHSPYLIPYKIESWLNKTLLWRFRRIK